jgi:hypothetical protein
MNETGWITWGVCTPAIQNCRTTDHGAWRIAPTLPRLKVGLAANRKLSCSLGFPDDSSDQR